VIMSTDAKTYRAQRALLHGHGAVGLSK